MNFKQYFYCDQHGGACFMITPSKETLYLYTTRQCCSNEQRCALRYIGTRTYIDDKLTEDTTPSDEWFDRRGGGYLKEYLDNAFQIELMV